MIIDGTVSIQIKNNIIERWEWANTIFKSLKKWKTFEFDKKVEKAMKVQFNNHQFEVEKILNRKIREAEGSKKDKKYM